MIGWFREQVANRGDAEALMYRGEDDLFTTMTWREIERRVNALAASLAKMGVQPGDRVAIFSENRREMIVSDLAIKTVGAADVPIHQPLTGKQAAYQINDSGSKICFVSNAEQLKKIGSVIDSCPQLKTVICYEGSGQQVGGWRDAIGYQGLIEEGTAEAAEAAARSAELSDGSSLATIIYTSGTTGEPKGVMLSNNNFVSNLTGALQVQQPLPDDLRLTWLPLSHSFARTADYYSWIATGIKMAVIPGPNTLPASLKEIRPTLISCVPHFYENAYRFLVEMGLDKDPQALKDFFGGRIRICSSGGAPLSANIIHFFEGHGIPMLEGYGLTETSPVITFNREGAAKPGTVGQAIPNVEVKIADDGEILSRGPHIMMGYWNKPEATAEVIKEDGWFCTGDIGELDDEGYLTITGRKKELIVTAGGKNIAPRYIEALMAEDKYILQAVLYGDNQHYLTALIVPNFNTLVPALKKMGIEATSHQELVKREDVYAFLDERVKAALADVARFEQVKKFAILDRALTLEDGEMTPTLKVRRSVVFKKHAALIEGLYSEEARGERRAG
jgi:long-chain acyl-CoA synthetase